LAVRLKAGHACDIVDLSAGGAMLETESRLVLGRTVELQLATAVLTRHDATRHTR